MTTNYLEFGPLRVAEPLARLVEEQMTREVDVSAAQVWAAFAEIVSDLGPELEAALERRNALQRAIDSWLKERQEGSVDAAEQRRFLTEIGYLEPQPEPFSVSPEKVDPEIATIAGPQLVVPVDNARYALNAANARWGSLYDALYGTDVIPETDGAEKGGEYNPVRGDRVVQFAAELLDRAAPLLRGSHADCTGYAVENGALVVTLGDEATTLAEREQFSGYVGEKHRPTAILLNHHGLHLDIQIDPTSPIGKRHAAGVKDIILEAALSVIADCEDSVAAVDAQDKAGVYSNWFGLMTGTLTAQLQKSGRSVTRSLNPDRQYTTPGGQSMTLPGRAVLLTRNVGHHMYTDAVTDQQGSPVPEGFLDAMICALASKHDLSGKSSVRNSRAGSIYFVKPKQHGSQEVALTVELYRRIEGALSLPRNTIKIGIMDEERRTTVNLDACINAARDRVIFINTGFLDRTGDEIHTMMELGPTAPKHALKDAPWMLAYEDWNVDVGLACGMRGHGQIGKGMWAIPNQMAKMLETKAAHPRAGASTAWVPSPTAATLHAIHYHDVDVAQQQESLAARPRADLDEILTMPVYRGPQLTENQIQAELDNNAQGILGYVIRWVEQGIGCSTVPDISNVGLMEDRATLRISSQHIANWLHHGVVSRSQVLSAFERMAAVVDKQNDGDPAYRNMTDNPDGSVGFQAALDLVFKGRQEPNGYTESVLHERRREFKRTMQ